MPVYENCTDISKKMRKEIVYGCDADYLRNMCSCRKPK